MTRRDALRCLALAPALTTIPIRAMPLRISLIGPLGEESRRGVEFGVAEALHAVRLLGRELLVASATRSVPGIAGCIVEAPRSGEMDPAVPTISLALSSPPRHGCRFSVRVSAKDRRQALARWRADHPGDGARAIVEWHGSLVRYGASELNERYAAKYGRPMTAAAWAGWFAVKALTETALRGGGRTPCESLAAARFDGHKGRALSFDRTSGELRQPLYVLRDDTVLGEIS